MNQIYNDNIKRPKSQHSAWDLKNLCILPENSADSAECWSYIVSAFENTARNLVVQGRVQLEHSSHIIKISVEVTC